MARTREREEHKSYFLNRLEDLFEQSKFKHLSDLDKKCDLKEGTISSWMNADEPNPTMEKIVKIVQAHPHITADWLLGLEPTKDEALQEALIDGEEMETKVYTKGKKEVKQRKAGEFTLKLDGKKRKACLWVEEE